jgi:phosphate starvation-inducible PhoH-like protein
VTKRSNYPKGQRAEAVLTVDDTSVLQHLVGEQDAHLQTIRRLLDVEIGRDGPSLVIRGNDSEVELARDLLGQLKELFEQGEHIWASDIERAIKMLSQNRKLRLSELFRDQVKISGRKHPIVPKTFKQKQYIESAESYDVVFGVGPAGTGKTYLAMAMAVSALMKKQVKRVVLCRPAVEAGEKLGFLPGDMAEKVNPYLRPLYDALHDMVDFERAKELVERGIVEVAPLAFMRGRTLNSSFVILDEAQNTTPGQMKMLLTRLGFGSKCFVTGDVTQIDLPRGQMSGLVDALQTLHSVDGIGVVRFSDEDVIRHPLVSRIIQAYDRREQARETP